VNSSIPIDSRTVCCVSSTTRQLMRGAPSCLASAAIMIEMPVASPIATTAQSTTLTGTISMATRLDAARTHESVIISYQRSATYTDLSMPITSWPSATSLVPSEAPKLPNPNTINFIGCVVNEYDGQIYRPTFTIKTLSLPGDIGREVALPRAPSP